MRGNPITQSTVPVIFLSGNTHSCTFKRAKGEFKQEEILMQFYSLTSITEKMGLAENLSYNLPQTMMCSH